MLDWLRGDKQPEEKGNTEYSNEINSFHQRVSKTISDIESFANSLDPEYEASALSSMSLKFQKIDKEYTNFTIIKTNSFYGVINRSKSRLNTTKKVAQKAKNLAKLFEKYAKKPNSYSTAEVRSQINKLVGELINLKA